MSSALDTPQTVSKSVPNRFEQMRQSLPAVPDALARLLLLVVVALFLNTFVLQPYVIPSESMERTLLVGDFVLVNKQAYAPAGVLSRGFMPYRDVERGDIVVFHHPRHPYVVKRVIGLPGDRLHIADGRVTVNGVLLAEPYAAFEPAFSNSFRDDEYFVLGDNRNYSDDSRFWGFVSRQQIVARPLVIYFSLSRPSTTDVHAADDKLGNDRELSARLQGFARWKRILHVVH
jgi:signal peptidase I